MKKLYAVKAECHYGEFAADRRAEQVALLESLGLQEFDKFGTSMTVCDADQVLALVKGGYVGKYGVADAIEIMYEPSDSENPAKEILETCIQKMQEVTIEMFNNKCQQEQPSEALFNVDETMLVEDSCTDALQEKLAVGWRILAVQPQPNQRRPDYILGRNSRKGSTSLSALRG